MVELPEGHLLNNRYEILSSLGAGGMGSVYLARDTVLTEEVVALKVLHADYTRDEAQMQRFLREVQLMRRVNHPNVVRTFDVGAAEGVVFFSMEYVPGRPLSDLIDEQVIDRAFAPELLIQVSEGLSAIHEANIVHRDLKPGNLMITENGNVKITDFGVARPATSDLTAHDEIIGSVHYMAPEVWLGKEITGAADYYGLGIILYELVTGALPFQHERPATLMWMHVKSEPIAPIQLNPELEPWVNKLILKLMSKSPLDRPRNAKEVTNVVNFYVSRQTNSVSRSNLSTASATFSRASLAGIKKGRKDTSLISAIGHRSIIKKVRGAGIFQLNVFSSLIVTVWMFLLVYLFLLVLVPKAADLFS